MIKKFILCFFYSLLFSFAHTQAFLVLETSGKVKTLKFPVGSDIRIHLKDDKNYLWHNHTITGLDEKAKCIWVSERYCIKLQDIDGIDLRPGKGNNLAKAAAKFGIPFLAYTGVQYFTGPPLTNFHLVLGTGSVLVWGISKLFFNGQLKIKSKRRLRIIDLTMTPPNA